MDSTLEHSLFAAFNTERVPQIAGWYLALISGFDGCQIVLIHVLGGRQIVSIRLNLDVSC